MPALGNDKHEAVVLAYVAEPERIGWRAYQAIYPNASQRASETGFSRLLKNAEFSARIAELDEAATNKAVDAIGLSKERVLAELAKIAFSDLRKALEWHGTLVQEQDNPDGGDVLVIKNIFSNHVRLVDSDKLDADTAGAIAEVRQSPTGGLSIKLHDKRGALVDLGKHLGLFKERVEHSGPNGGPIEVAEADDLEVARRIAFMLARGLRATDPGKA